MNNAWRGFSVLNGKTVFDVQEFIKDNYTEYVGDDSFLEGPTEATNELWQEIVELKKQEIANGGFGCRHFCCQYNNFSSGLVCVSTKI